MAKADKEIKHYGAPICIECKHFRHDNYNTNNETFTCKAFPRGIPEPILTSDFDHRKPHPEDGGIKFESIEVKDLYADLMSHPLEK